MGEDVSDMATTTSSLQAKLLALTGGKVDIMLDANTFKSTTQILREMADAWEDMTDIERASALELMGGKRQANVLSALIQNFDTAERAIEASAKSSGSALRENEVYLDSIQGKLDQLTNATQTLWNNTLNADAVKFFVDIGTQLVKLVDQFGLIKTLVVGIGTYLIQKHWKGDLMGGLFGGDIEDAKNKLKLVEDKLAKLQGKKSTPLNQKRINKLQGIKTETEQYIKEYDELSEKLKKYRAESEGAKKSLDDFNKKLANKAAKGKKITDNDIKQQSNLNAKYDESNKKVKQTEAELAKAEMQANATGNAGLTAGQKIKTGFASAAKSVGIFAKQVASSMLTMYAITSVLELITKAGHWLEDWVDGWKTTPEEAKEEFEELNNELSQTKSELHSLESELDSTNDRIDELLEKSSLSLVEQDELEKLRSQSDELERQIELTKQLQEVQQTSVNTQSLYAANKYAAGTSFYSSESKSDRQKEAKETGETIGSTAGLIIGGVIGTYFGGQTLIGAGVGSAIGKFVGGLFGSSIGGSSYDSELTVGEALDRMAMDTARLRAAKNEAYEVYTKTGSEGDKKKWQEASKALSDYNSTLAEHISQLQAYVNAVDYSMLVDPDEQQAYLDALDDVLAYSIIQGVAGATGSAIDSIFSDELITEDAKELKNAIISALEAGQDIDFMDFEDSRFDAIKERLADVGISVTDLIAHWRELKEAEDAVAYYETYDVVKEVASLEDGIGALKDAFDEFNESGMVTAQTLIKLNEVFGNVEGWKEYVDVMSTGVASTEEAAEVTNQLAENLLKDILMGNPFNLNATDGFKSYLTAIQQLKSIGVTNAKELVDAMQQKAMVKKVIDEMDKDASRIEELEKKKVLTTEEQTELQELKSKNQDDYVEAVEKEYGIQIKNTNLLEKQIKSNEISDKVKAYKEYQNDFFVSEGDNKTALEDFNKSLEASKANAKKLNSLIVQRDNLKANAFDNMWITEGAVDIDTLWESAKELFTFGKADTKFDEYQGVTGDISATQGLLADEVEKRQALFDDLVELANTEGIDLGGIDLTAFDATDTGDNSVFAQVYNVVQKYVDDKTVELEKLEETIKTELDTAFTEVGLEVVLELQDKDKLVDDIQSIYDELSSAQKEYAENGYISVDTMQSLLKLEPKYLDLLVDENGNLNLTKDKLTEVARARIIDLGLKQQSAIVEQAYALAQEGSREALDEWIIVNEEADESMKDSISTTKQLILSTLLAKEAAGVLPEGYANNFMTILENQLNAVQRVTDIALSDLDNTLSTSGNILKDQDQEDFDKLMSRYDNRISANQAKYDQIQNDIDWLESQGKMADVGYYKDQIALLTEGEESKEAFLEAKLQGAAARLRELEKAGKKGSDEWWEAAKIYNDTLSELDDVRDAVIALQDAIGEVEWAGFEEFNTRLDDINSKLGTMRDLIALDGEEDWFDDEGNWTAKGVAVLGSYVQSLEYYKNGLSEASAALDNFNEKSTYEGNEQWFADTYGIHSEQEYYDYLQKLTDEQYNDAKSVSSTEQDIAGMWESQIDAVEEYIETLVDSYNDYIDVVKESLDAERDLYNFKKNVQKQTKDIASLERRITALSGSDNAADIAERRKLEAQLAEQREALNDTYYEHSIDSQQEALDAEAQAYEESMNKFVENLRTNLDLALEDMDGFMAGVTAAVTANAPLILDEYEKLGISLDSAIVAPWQAAKDAMDGYTKEDGLGLMNSWTAEGGVFDTFATDASDYLTSIWTDTNIDPDDAFENAITSKVEGIKESIRQNVETAKGYLTDLYDVKDDPSVQAPSGNNDGNGDGGKGGSAYNANVAVLQEVLNTVFSAGLTVDGKFGNATTNALKKAQAKMGITSDGKYGPQTRDAIKKYIDNQVMNWRTMQSPSSMIGQATQQYIAARAKLPDKLAKGTMGLKRDQFAITDESWIGEEITLAAGKNGQLQYLKKGSAVMPADISANLVEWGKLNPNMLNAGATPNINMISNAISKPEFNITFDSLIKAENITEETLPAVKKLVTQELNRFTRELNYAIKGKGGR